MNSHSLPLPSQSNTAETFEKSSFKELRARVLLNYNPPVDDAPQSGRKHTPGRDGCPKVDKSLTALVPESYLALTVAESPTFWFYIPYPSNVIKLAELVLWDGQQQNKVDEAIFSVTHTPGIISVRLPKTALEIGKWYRVDFSVTCRDGNTNTTVGKQTVTTWLKRVILSDHLSNQLKATATPRERYVLYAANSLWYEALTELAELRLAQNQDEQVASDWETLLSQKEINLPELIPEPIVSCCTSK